MGLYAEEGGSGEHLLVLLHGLGATGAVWAPLVAIIGSRWRGSCFVPDLPGHGCSARALRYSAEDAALAVGDALAARAQKNGWLVVLGHSFGGAVGLALASGRFGVQPSVVFGVGIKLQWREEDFARMRAIAARPAPRFATEAEAWERYLKVSGLAGLVAGGSGVTARGIARDADGWRLAMDPAANDAGKPDFNSLMAAARCRVHLAVGRHDQLVTLEHTRALDPSAMDLGPYGHNVLVESPETVWSWVESHLQE